MATTWQPKQLDADGLYLKDRIWRYVCQYMVEHSITPDWDDVKIGARVPNKADEKNSVHILLLL